MKNLNKGDFLIDDRTKNGAGEFEGELILFGSEKFPDWKRVCEYLEEKNDFAEKNVGVTKKVLPLPLEF